MKIKTKQAGAELGQAQLWLGLVKARMNNTREGGGGALFQKQQKFHSGQVSSG